MEFVQLYSFDIDFQRDIRKNDNFQIIYEVFEDKNKKKQKKLLKFWKMIGSRTIIMKPDVHDRIFSITSHLPHLISYNLIKTALDFQKKYKKNIKLE